MLRTTMFTFWYRSVTIVRAPTERRCVFGKAVSKLRHVGYARVSTSEQKLELQLDALRAYGCSKIYEDAGVSGSFQRRPGLDECLADLADGDVLVVWRLDRLGRSLQHLLEIVGGLKDRGIGLISLTESIDTTSPTGRLIFSIFGALAEYERSLIAERVRAGMTAAKERGRHVGRRPALNRPRLALARRLVAEGESPAVVARMLKVGRTTIYRALKKAAA